jgi:hypothetical protein
MTRFPRCAALALCVSAAVLALAPPAPAQRASGPPGVPFAYRADAFRRLLYDLELKPLWNFSQLRQDPGDCLLVVLGETNGLNPANLPDGLRDFAEQGGAVLVATDRGPDEQAASFLLALTGVTVSGIHLEGPSNAPELLYRGKSFCPILLPRLGGTPDLFRGFPRGGKAGMLSVATNTPSSLASPRLPDQLPGLAWLPDGSAREGTPPQNRRRGDVWGPLEVVWKHAGGLPPGKGPLFAVGGSVGDGRVLLLADHSVFINQMMIPPDNDNLEFASNCLQWLRDGTRHRTRALFIEEGFIHTDFNVPLKEGPGLPPDALRKGLVILENTLARLEDNGTLDAAVLERLGANRFGGIDLLVRRALEILTILLLVYLVYRVGSRGRFRLDSAVPLLAHEVARHTPAAPLLEQRYRSALQAGSLWETAHSLARQWFASLPLAGGPVPPRVVVRGGWLHGLGLRRRFRRLWRLAHDITPVRVGPRALRGLLRDIDEMKAALADGRLLLQ